ncbi:MAG: hypothetical protein JWR63_4259, partial [Conexibacter sp.]|nr:hypothetical protein [Conexibacter sp.]
GGQAAASGAARAALELVQRYTGVIDAYISSAVEPVRGRRVVRRVAVLMPGADVLAAKEVTGPAPRDELAWRTALADVVTDDRAEHVGGRRNVRPAVGVR